MEHEQHFPMALVRLHRLGVVEREHNFTSPMVRSVEVPTRRRGAMEREHNFINRMVRSRAVPSITKHRYHVIDSHWIFWGLQDRAEFEVRLV
jgi:hypothetical protein